MLSELCLLIKTYGLGHSVAQTQFLVILNRTKFGICNIQIRGFLNQIPKVKV